MRTLIASIVLAALAVLVPAVAAAPAQAAATPTVCANDHRTLSYGVVHGTVYYRDCNNGQARWVEDSVVKASYNYHGGIGCSGFTHLDYFKVTFHLNSNGGKSLDPWIKLPCKTSGHFSHSYNVDGMMGRTYPSHFAFGETFKAVLVHGRDSTHNRYGKLG